MFTPYGECGARRVKEGFDSFCVPNGFDLARILALINAGGYFTNTLVCANGPWGEGVGYLEKPVGHQPTVAPGNGQF